MASSESLFVTSLVQLVVRMGEISAGQAKDVVRGGRYSGYDTEVTFITVKLSTVPFHAVMSLSAESYFFFDPLDFVRINLHISALFPISRKGLTLNTSYL